MTYQDMLENAKKNIGPYCKACIVCNGLACRNQIPGPGAKGNGDNAINNYKAWQNYRILTDPINDIKDVDTTFNFFETKLSAPIFIGPVGSVKSHYGDLYDDLEYNQMLLKGAKEANILACLGDGKNPSVMESAAKTLSELDGFGIPTIKPWDMDTVYSKLDLVKKAHPKAIAMDIDACGLPFLKNQNPPAGTKTVAELKNIIKKAEVPFIVKGVLSLSTARKAYEAGASAIVISNHGGRILESTISTLEALKDIAKEFKGKMTLIVDGGIRSGADIFKALALGADCVLIARPYVVSIYGAGKDGVKLYTDKLIGELKDTMLLCGCKKLSDINESFIKYEKIS